MSLINTGPLVKYNEASTVEKEYAEFIGLKGFDLQPNAESDRLFVTPAMTEQNLARHEVNNFVNYI